MELGVYLSEGDMSEFRLHAGLRLEKDAAENRFDLGADRAFMIWGEMAKSMIGLRFDRAINIQQRDILGSTREAESARRTFLGSNQTSLWTPYLFVKPVTTFCLCS